MYSAANVNTLCCVLRCNSRDPRTISSDSSVAKSAHQQFLGFYQRSKIDAALQLYLKCLASLCPTGWPSASSWLASRKKNSRWYVCVTIAQGWSAERRRPHSTPASHPVTADYFNSRSRVIRAQRGGTLDHMGEVLRALSLFIDWNFTSRSICDRLREN
jgi:hypothetical protein